MNSGRELDALVAEKVMGFKKVQHFDREVTHESPEGCLIYADFLPAPEAMKIPSYSTDIAAAWEIVEKLPLLIELQSPGAPCNDNEYENNSNEWKAEARATIHDRSVFARAATAPHVICLAALKVIENNTTDV